MLIKVVALCSHLGGLSEKEGGGGGSTEEDGKQVTRIVVSPETMNKGRPLFGRSGFWRLSAAAAAAKLTRAEPTCLAICDLPRQ